MPAGRVGIRVCDESEANGTGAGPSRSPDEAIGCDVGAIHIEGLPDHFELWKESFRGRAEDQRSLARLIADLEKEANEEEAGTGQQTKVAAMFKAAASNEKIMAMFQASKTARPTNDENKYE